MPEILSENTGAIWMINRLKWSFLDGMGAIDLQGIIEAMKIYGVPETSRADLLERIVSLTRMVQATRDKGHGQ